MKLVDLVILLACFLPLLAVMIGIAVLILREVSEVCDPKENKDDEDR